MKYLFLLLCPFLSLAAQDIAVQHVVFTEEDGNVVVTYDLVGQAGRQYRINLLFSPENNGKYQECRATVGDVGEFIAPGYGKRIVWTGEAIRSQLGQAEWPQAIFQVHATEMVPPKEKKTWEEVSRIGLRGGICEITVPATTVSVAYIDPIIPDNSISGAVSVPGQAQINAVSLWYEGQLSNGTAIQLNTVANWSSGNQVIYALAAEMGVGKALGHRWMLRPTLYAGYHLYEADLSNFPITGYSLLVKEVTFSAETLNVLYHRGFLTGRAALELLIPLGSGAYLTADWAYLAAAPISNRLVFEGQLADGSSATARLDISAEGITASPVLTSGNLIQPSGWRGQMGLCLPITMLFGL